MKKAIGVFLFFFMINISLMGQEKSFQYLALGDSYTIGEAVSAEERWPVQLTRYLNSRGLAVQDPTIIATTGWTTDQLMQAIDNARLDSTYQLVSLLIGVNNQYRGYEVEVYKKEFELLLKQAISFAENRTNQVFVVSIPDYGITPFAAEKGLDVIEIAEELGVYNGIAKEICAQYEVVFFNITPISLKAKVDATYLAEDLLHPSGKMYTEWVSLFQDFILDKLKEK